MKGGVAKATGSGVGRREQRGGPFWGFCTLGHASVPARVAVLRPRHARAGAGPRRPAPALRVAPGGPCGSRRRASVGSIAPVTGRLSAPIRPALMPSRPLVSALARVLRSAPVVGVSGSRAASPGCVRAVTWAVGQVQPGTSIVTGCMSGIDQVARSLAPSALVLQASHYGRGRGRFARRSTAVVQRVHSAGPSALWVSAPGRACPQGLVPSPVSSACFAGFGSGSWASLALALGLGVRALVWLPVGITPPQCWGLSLVCPGRAGSWWGTLAVV